MTVRGPDLPIQPARAVRAVLAVLLQGSRAGGPGGAPARSAARSPVQARVTLRVPASTVTVYAGSGVGAGPPGLTEPSVMSNRLPWHGHWI